MTNGNSTANVVRNIAYRYDERSLLTSYTDTGDTKEIMESDPHGNYRSLGSANNVLGALIDAFTTANLGWSVAKKIPIYQSVQLNRLFLVWSEVCIDECGKETSRRRLSENPQDNYQEVFFIDRREGEPIRVGPGPAPNFGSRWGYGKRPR